MNEEMMKMMNGMGGAFMGDLDGFKSIISDAVGDALDKRDMGVDIEELEDLRENLELAQEVEDDLRERLEYFRNEMAEIEEELDDKEDIIFKLTARNKMLESELSNLETPTEEEPLSVLFEDNNKDTTDIAEIERLVELFAQFKKLTDNM